VKKIFKRCRPDPEVLTNPADNPSTHTSLNDSARISAQIAALQRQIPGLQKQMTSLQKQLTGMAEGDAKEAVQKQLEAVARQITMIQQQIAALQAQAAQANVARGVTRTEGVQAATRASVRASPNPLAGGHINAQA
jgi:chaperonin cofactor prefoldin